MKMISLDNQVSVSDQIDVDDVAELQRQGVAIVVCNRPDGEVAGQTEFRDIEQSCDNLGMACHHLPFVGDAVADSDVARFLELLNSGKRVHAYCRSGTRSSKLWARARRRQGSAADELLARAGQAGYDVSLHLQE